MTAPTDTPEAPSELHALAHAMSAAENAFVESYELDDGEHAPHRPSDFESMLITDAIAGLLADEDWQEAYRAWDVARRAAGYQAPSVAAASAASLVAEPVAWTHRLNMLESCANWLESRSHCVTLNIKSDPIEGGGYENLMRKYAEDLRTIRSILAAPLPASPAQPVGAAEMTNAARDVLAERARQVSVEGYTPGHDDEHGYGELARAAACYALGKMSLRALEWSPDIILWPWEKAAWKYDKPRRSLVKSAALALSAIECIDRIGKVVDDWTWGELTAPKVEAPVARAEGEALSLAEEAKGHLAQAIEDTKQGFDVLTRNSQWAMCRECIDHLAALAATPKAEPPASGLRAETDAGGEVS